MKNSNVSWIGNIPNEWNVLRIKNAFYNNKELVKEDWVNIQLLSLTTKGIKEKNIDDLSGKRPDSYTTYQKVKPDDIVMCLFDLDCSAVFSGISQYNGMISPAYDVLKAKETIIPKYASYLFNYIEVDRKFAMYSKNLRFTIGYNDFSALPMLFPPLKDQQKIADYLDNRIIIVESEIEKNNKSIELMEEYRKSTINSSVVNGIRNKKNQKSLNDFIDTIPSNWEEKKIRFLFKCDRGNIDKKIKDDEIEVKLIPYTSIYKNRSQYISNNDFLGISVKEQELINGQVYKEDVLLTASSESADDIGHSSVIMEEMPNFVFGSDILRLKCKKNIDINYLKYIFENHTCLKKFESLCRGTTRFRFSMDDFKNVIIPVPPIEEQKEIAEYLDNKCYLIDKVINYRKQLIEKLEEYKKSLIYEAVTGKIEV